MYQNNIIANVMLKDISGHLDSNGDIRNSNHVNPFINLMTQAEKISHCCAFINIIKRTLVRHCNNNDTSVIDMFLKNGGLDVLLKWLNHAKNLPDYKFMRDLLDLYKELPLNMDILLLNQSTLDLISSIAVSEQVPSECKSLATEISMLWKKLTSIVSANRNSFYNEENVADIITNNPNLAKKEIDQKQKLEEKTDTCINLKYENNFINRNKKSKEQHQVNNGKSLISSDHSEIQFNAKQYISENESIYIPSDSSEDNSSLIQIHDKKDEYNEYMSFKLKPQQSFKIQNRKEVDELKSNFSNLKQDDLTLGKTNYKIIKNSADEFLPTNVLTSKVINFDSGFKIPKRSRNEILNVDIPEKKMKNDVTDITCKTKDVSKLEEKNKYKKTIKKNKMEKTGANSKIITEHNTEKKSENLTLSKVIDSIPKNKDDFCKDIKMVENPKAALKARNQRHIKNHFESENQDGVHDSDAFMEALNSAIDTNRTIKNQLNNPLRQTITNKSQINNLEDKKVSKADDTEIDAKVFLNVDSDYNINDLQKQEVINNTDQKILSRNNLNETNLKKTKVKKKVIWADSCSKQLEDIFYFILDENEKVIKKSAFKGDISKIEKLNEREMRDTIRNLTDEATDNEIWPSLIPIDIPDTVITPEIKSEEKIIQADREKTTLAMLLFKPDSAFEPDVEDANTVPAIKTKIIPLEDLNFNENLLKTENHEFINTPIEEIQVAKEENFISLINQIPTNNLFPSDEATENIKMILKQIEEHKTSNEQTPLTGNHKNALCSQLPINLENTDFTVSIKEHKNVNSITNQNISLNKANAIPLMQISDTDNGLEPMKNNVSFCRKDSPNLNSDLNKKNKFDKLSNNNYLYQKDRYNYKNRSVNINSKHRSFNGKKTYKKSNDINIDRSRNTETSNQCGTNNKFNDNSEKLVVNNKSGFRWI